MSIFKKLLAGISSIAIALSFTACADTSWASKINGTEIKAGVYIFYVFDGYNSATAKFTAEQLEGDIFKEKIEEKDVATYVKDYATDKTKRLVVINDKFDELGLTFDETSKKAVKLDLDTLWEKNGDYYSKQGISKSSLNYILQSNKKENLIFDKYYAKDGLEAVSQADIDTQIQKEYARAYILPISLKNAEGTVDATSTADAQKKADDYLKRATDGENFSDLMDAYYKELNPQATEDSSTTELVPHKNEAIIFEGYQSIEESVVTEILEKTKLDEPVLIKGVSMYYVVKKLDILGRADVILDLTPSILRTLKFDDFDKMINGIYADYSFEMNEKAYERYSPEDVIKRSSK